MNIRYLLIALAPALVAAQRTMPQFNVSGSAQTTRRPTQSTQATTGDIAEFFELVMPTCKEKPNQKECGQAKEVITAVIQSGKEYKLAPEATTLKERLEKTPVIHLLKSLEDLSPEAQKMIPNLMESLLLLFAHHASETTQNFNALSTTMQIQFAMMMQQAQSMSPEKLEKLQGHSSRPSSAPRRGSPSSQVF